MVLTEEVANYPGVETTKGYLLANTMKNQAKSFGCKIKSNLKIKSYDLDGEIKKVVLEDGREFSGRTVILSPGGRPRPVGMPGEEELKGKGISYCATCDGDFFTGIGQENQVILIRTKSHQCRSISGTSRQGFWIGNMVIFRLPRTILFLI